jgi:hypothetical protein
MTNPAEDILHGKTGSTRKTTQNDETLYSDMDYLKSAVSFFAGKDRYHIANFETLEGVEIGLMPDLKRRLAAVLPEEVMPTKEYIRLSPDRAFCMEEMRRSLQNSMSEAAWPGTQYLWPLHPVFDWIHDKARLLYKRSEAPLIGISGGLAKGECIFIAAGIIPNRRSTPVIDEWFGLHFSNGAFTGVMTMHETLAKSGYGKKDAPNRLILTDPQKQAAEALLPIAVGEAEKVLERYYKEYDTRIKPQITREIEKLEELEKRHKQAIVQLELFEKEKTKKEREIDTLFDEFTNWVRDTLEVEDKPYLRIIAVLAGV